MLLCRNDRESWQVPVVEPMDLVLGADGLQEAFGIFGPMRPKANIITAKPFSHGAPGRFQAYCSQSPSIVV